MTESPLMSAQLNLVETIDEAYEMKRWLGERRNGTLCIDTESGGLSPWRDDLRMVQIGDKSTGWAIPWERWGGAALEMMSSWDGEWGLHNGPYDWRVIAVNTGFKLPWHKIRETLTMARIDDPSRPNGLKPLGTNLVDRRSGAYQRLLDEAMSKGKYTWATVPIECEPYWQYSASDPVITSYLDEYFWPKIQATAPGAYDLEMAANRICTLMMMKGLQLDVPYVEKAIEQYGKTSGEIRAWLKESHQISSPKSGGQLQRAFEKLGQENKFWTKGNAPQFDKAALAWYEKNGQNDAVKQLAKYIRAVRHIEDISGRYLENFLSIRDSGDLVHCNINVMGARTGRMSVSDPALQQLPRDDVMIRGSFVPREGHVFISCDLDQIEMRLLAHLTRDPGLIGAFMEAEAGGADFFTAVARVLYQDEHLVKKDPRRQLVKNASYARAYGSGEQNLAETANVTIPEIKVFERIFDERFPGMARLMNSLESTAKRAFLNKERGGVRLESGRFLPCDEGKEYATLNYLIQGTASEYMKQALVHLDSAGLTDYMCLPIHDECLLEVPKEDAQDVLHVVEECMSNRSDFLVPITAGGVIMEDRWAKA